MYLGRLSAVLGITTGLVSLQLAPLAAADQVILDDLIVDGSICVGFDCVNGESFGFDTLRLKENNLRIKFQDTSTSASFPSNDWQITINDTSNGGANKFSIDDISGGRTPFTIEASAPSHSLYVDDGGRIGLGTATPVADIHVKSGNTPTLRLEQDGTSGFTAQTWDLAGNEANFFIRDATNGSTLPFRVFPGAPSNALNVEGTTGDVGLGTTSPDSELDIEADGPGIRLTNVDNGMNWDIETAANGRLVVKGTSKAFKISHSADGSLLHVGVDADDEVTVGGNLNVTGTITVGATQVHPDYVFQPTYPLKSIDEHAKFMWANSHLPAVDSAATIAKTGSYNLVSQNLAILEELEVAHIYIAQLHERLEALEAKLGESRP